MKVKLNDVEVLDITQTQLDVIANDIPSEILEDDIKRRLAHIVTHKYDQCHKRLVDEWLPKLIANGVASVPTDKEAFAQLVFAQSNYKNRSARELEAKAAKGE